MNKYRAVKTGGRASKREYKRAMELQMLEKAGEIHGLMEQVEFVLIPSQKGADGKVIERPVKYFADFVYHDKQLNLVVEDSKGFKTPEYILKRKLMLHVHGIRVVET
jgi:hypothetical protein